MNSAPESTVTIDQIVYQLKSIDEFGFSVRIDLPVGVRGKGLLMLGNDKLEVGFRVRENNGGNARCSFSNLSTDGAELIQSFLCERNPGVLDSTTYPSADKKSANGNSGNVGNVGDVGLTDGETNLESDSDFLDTLPATDASDGQSDTERQSSGLIAWSFDTMANLDTATNDETSASQWESIKTIQSSPARTKNSDKYIAPVESNNSVSRTVAPQAISKPTPNQTTIAPPSVSVSDSPQPSASNAPASRTIEPQLPSPKTPVHQSVVPQSPTSYNVSSAEITETPMTPVKTNAAFESTPENVLEIPTASTPVVAEQSSPRPIESRSEDRQPATSSPSVSSSRSDATAGRAARRTNSTEPRKRSFALPIILALTGLCFIAAYFLRSPATPGFSQLGDSAPTTTILPVTVKADGEVVELMVAEGDLVKKGDVLMRLENASMQVKKNQLMAQLTTADAEINALKRQLDSNEKRIELANKKLKLDLAVAKSELAAANENAEQATANRDRMQPAFDSGAITKPEFEEVRRALLAAQANKMSAKNAVKQVEFALGSAKDKILISDGKFDDKNGRLLSELEIAAAKHEELEVALAAAEGQLSCLNVKAPRDGVVSAVYRQIGELVKVADQTVGLSVNPNSSRSLTEGKSLNETPRDSSHQNNLNGKVFVADKVASDL